MKRLKTRLLFLLLIPLTVLFVLILNYLWNLKSLAFAPENLLRIFPQGLANRRNISNEELEQIFNQRFIFLDEGAQCFACASEDGRYVIKLFKAKHMRKKEWLRDGPLFRSFVPAAQREQHKRRWLQKFQETCACYFLAYDELADETGLLHLHFQTESLQAKLKVQNFEIELDGLPFLIQKKGELVPKKIASLIENSGSPAAITALIDLHDLLVKRAKKGITDPRQCFSINYAFCGSAPLQIDVGRIVKEAAIASAPQDEIDRVTANLKAWVGRHFPELSSDFEASLLAHPK